MMNGFLIRTLWNMMGMFEMFKWGYVFNKFDCIEWVSIKTLARTGVFFTCLYLST